MTYKIFLFFVLSSCSIFIEKFEQDILEQHNITPKVTTTKLTCQSKAGISLISENKKSQLSFKQFLENVPYKLKGIEKAVLWSLIQMNLRPDQSSPSSKLQVLLKDKNQTFYYQGYTKKDGSYPYLKTLDLILKEHKSRRNIYQLAKILDRFFKAPLFVSNGLESFLVQRKANIQKHEQLAKLYTRGDETLKENEKITKTRFTKFIQSYAKNSKDSNFNVNQQLFTNDSSPHTKVSCNFNMKLYEDSIFLINSKQVRSNIFGLKDDDIIFMAMSSNSIKEIESLNGTIFFKGSSDTRSGSLCVFQPKNKINKQAIWLLADNSRDPGQHLFHLFQYGLHQASDFKKLAEMLSFSRHQFLKDPIRLLIESRKSSEKQLEQLLKLNIPIYNAKKLGRLWGHMELDKKSSFILDERRPGHILCN